MTDRPMLKFWLWLREFANRMVREQYEFGPDLKCPHCLTRVSEGYPLVACRDRETLMPKTICGRCKRESAWADHGIIWECRTTVNAAAELGKAKESTNG